MKMKNLQTAPRQRSLSARHSINTNNITTTISGWMIALAICCLALVCPLSSAYNIDIPSYVQHKRLEPNTMFGFSIALHKGPAGPHTNSLVVGAPKFDTSSYQEDVIEAGAVFNCGMNDGDCHLVKFDSFTNNRNTHGDVIDRKSYQWLGATVATSRDNGLVVACAPRYVFHTMTPKKNLRWDPIGTCFTTRNFTHFKEVSPCRTNNWGYHRQGYCQAGLSAAATTEGDRLYIGAPGSWYWQGQAYSVSPDITFTYKPPYYQPFGTGGQTYSYDVTRPENQVFSTSESSSADDDSYLGYSMVTGHFNEDNIEDIAIGMPRGAGLLGKIVVNKWNMVNIFNITGHQIGEYFGYSLATADVDGNGLDDLIIGAPMYSALGNTEGKYDVGRVYVLLQSNGAARWKVEHIREGYNSKGRFGLALSTLGDINRDGYEDFAVGAPYDGPFGRGAVYIFHGSPNGPLEKPSQIIKSEDIVEGVPYPRTFGFSLSGGLDMDGNTYPDLAVGAYSSDQVYIFKSRPVAAVNAFTSFNSPSKLINIDEKRCQTQRDGKWVPCTDIMTCWNYNGEHLPNALEFDVSWVLDSKKPKTPRMFFLSDESKNIRNLSITLAYGKQFCHNETVYIIDNLQDKLTPLEVETRYNLRSSRQPAPLVRRKRDVLEPVIDQNREIVQRDAINIQKNCGADNICEPDLRLEIKTVDKYLLGSRQPLVIDVLISNMNEDAFEAAFYMVVPKDLDVNKVQAVGDKSDTPLTCTFPSQENNYTLKCSIGNPFPAKKVVNFKVNMLPSQKVGMAPSYDFYMEANSTNLEKPGSNFDNIISKNISIWVETDLTIDGISVPDFGLYKASDFKSIENATKEDDLGPQVVHLYNIFNKGPSVIEEAVILIHYPYQTAAGEMLMYMTNQPETAGSIRCDPHTAVNPLNLQLDQNLVRKSYLEERGVVEKNSYTGGAHIENSYGYGSGATAVSIGGGTHLSEEEVRRLEKEDEQAATGDASFVHSDRANAAANSQSGSGSGSGGSWSWSSSWNSTGNSPSVVVSSKNSSVHYDQQGRPHVVETSTEYVTGVDGTGRRIQAQQTSGNYQHQGGAAQQVSGNYQQQGGAAQQASGNYRQQGGAAQHTSGNYQYNGGAAQQTSAGYQQQGAGGAIIENQLIGGSQDARPRIQMANAQGEFQQQRTHSASGQPQRTTYTHSTSGSYNPQQQRVGSGAVYNELANTGGNFEKVAAGGNGFHTNTMDLGTLNRGNIDQELRTHGAPAQSNSYSYHQSYSSGNPQTHANYQQQSGSSSSLSSSSNFDNKPYYGTDEYYDDLTDPVQPSSSHIRVRRDDQDPMQIDLNSPCKATKCETLRCVARNLGKDDGVWVAIRTRMVAKTMEKLAGSVPLNISTMAVSHVTKLPYIGTPKDDIIRTHEVFYKAIPEPTPVPDVVPLWVVVLAACIGALILLLLILLLYNCGFFKRNRPSDQAMERQPLRNGYHGDEHL